MGGELAIGEEDKRGMSDVPFAYEKDSHNNEVM